ncbi:MAG TPA: amidohydrolase family protein [Caldilineaceae bacterium]|nr:amidohydrolase family protein [Caldilineaceae bacterium]HRW05836.1 amidohydrolase family protein [Caldilineaceae bacterium]
MSFVGDFEAYMPHTFNEQPYGKAGVLATLDEAGIDACVLFVGGVPDDPRPLNAEMLEIVAGEERILPGCLVNPTMGQLALDDLRRSVDKGARTVKLMAARHKYRLDSACVDPVLALAKELGITATIHSGSELSGCAPVYISALAQRHPDVTIIMDHMGYREWVGQAVDAAIANPNIYLGTTLIAAAEPMMIKEIVNSGQIGAERIVFGSNSPAGVAPHGVNGIRRVGFAAEAEAQILGENFKRIYRL